MKVALPYAVSVHGFIDKVGNYLAFAAIIGVALLVIMFFVQARETSLLRERAEDAEEDLERLREYAEQVARQSAAAAAAAARQPAQPQVQSRPAAAPAAARLAAARASSTPAGAPARPYAPVGVGAPALSSATRLIPLAGPVAAAAGVASAPAAAGDDDATVVPAVAQAPAPPPSTVAAGGVAPVTAPPAAARNGMTSRSAPAGDTGPVPPPRFRSAESSSPGTERAPRRDYGRAEDESRIGKGAVMLAAVLVAVIVAAAVIVITHHSHHASSTRAAQTTTTRASGKGSRTTAGTTVRVNPTQVRVAVLNGTATNNLAADVSARLNKVGFQQGATANYADQTQTATTVGYMPGDRAQGMAVAKALGIKPTSVQQVSTTARQLVCPGAGTTCSDQVVVTVGSNLNSDAS